MSGKFKLATNYQFNSNKTWSIVLTIDNGEYSIDYASIPCKSELKLLEISANRVVFEEEIRKGICVRDGIVELEIIDSNSIIDSIYIKSIGIHCYITA